MLGGEVSIFYEGIKDILMTNELKKNVLKLKEHLKEIECNKNILIVGSGGSYVTGLYAKYIIEDKMKNLCEVLKPMEVLQINLELYSYAIIYSYKMKNYDIKKAISYILKNKKIKKILIITAKETENKLENDRIAYIYYDKESDYERKYVSYKGIYLPTVMLSNCFENIDIEIKKLKSAKIYKNKTKTIDIFFDKNNYCLAQLIERHFCELGIATIRIHEKRDFSHGRMNILTKNEEVIYINSDRYDNEYDNLLYKYLKNIKECRILNESEFELNIKFNYLEKMMIALYWINECAEEHGVFLESKRDTKDDEELFKYGEENL